MEPQVKSKQRVADHGEVLTGEREVNAMLDLVKQETERIESRFLEPACGTGNFLVEVLSRKLAVVEARYARHQLDYERYAVLAVSSVYGIDILEDNVRECRNRLFELFDARYTARYKKKAREKVREAVRYILERNIIWGDALTLKTAPVSKGALESVGDAPRPIVFSEWSPVGRIMLKRRDFTFHELLREDEVTQGGQAAQPSLFGDADAPLVSDLGEDVFIPTPERDYPLMHFLEVANADEQGL